MNLYNIDILKAICCDGYITQRSLSEMTGHSVGIVNKSLRILCSEGYLDNERQLTDKAMDLLRENNPCRAVILAAGFGMRMMPINNVTPKALLEVNGEALIERLVRQLKAAGIKEIHVVVGFLKEKFEYLMDDYGVDLIVNDEYSRKNNLHSLWLAREYICNSYIIPCDIYARQNPFCLYELHSWYMVADSYDSESEIRANRKMELVSAQNSEKGNRSIGIAYLTKEDALLIKKRLEEMDSTEKNDRCFWEEAAMDKGRMVIPARIVESDDYTEINTYEQLRDLDKKSGHLQSEAIDTAASALRVRNEDITGITVLKKGMTNRSFSFMCRGRRYIMRIPGEGTDRLIDRAKEAIVYKAVSEKKISDEIVLLDRENGFKISEYIEDARVCDAYNDEDVALCMKRLREFHDMRIVIDGEFDIFRQIDFYESLRSPAPSVFRDYYRTKENVLRLKSYIEKYRKEYALAHIDAVPDNFLITSKNGEKNVRIIDWEYAGMQDQDVDIAMFCIYSLYDRKHVDRAIDAYYTEGCPTKVRTKIYCYISICGLLWSNWCEFKRQLGVEFGEYSLRQYHYAKEYYKIAFERIEGTKKI